MREHGACSSYFVDHGRLEQAISVKWYVKAPLVDINIDYAGCVFTRKSTFPWRQLDQSPKLGAGYAQLECRRVRVLRRSQRCQNHDDRFCEKCCAVCSWFGQQFSQECHGERRGARRIRHLHCLMLWFQEHVESGEDSDCTSVQETLENVEDGMAQWTSWPALNAAI